MVDVSVLYTEEVSIKQHACGCLYWCSKLLSLTYYIDLLYFCVQSIRRESTACPQWMAFVCHDACIDSIQAYDLHFKACMILNSNRTHTFIITANMHDNII